MLLSDLTGARHHFFTFGFTVDDPPSALIVSCRTASESDGLGRCLARITEHRSREICRAFSWMREGEDGVG